MNRSKIEWCDHTWNPITGCLHGCSYCYARTMTKRFCGDVRLNKMAKADYGVELSANKAEELYVLDKAMVDENGHSIAYPFEFWPTYHKYRLDMPTKVSTGCKIFVGAMADIFGDWVPDSWIKQIMAATKQAPQHRYLFLTKNPKRYIALSKKSPFLPDGEHYWYGYSVTSNGPFLELPKYYHKFISFEPLLDHIAMDENYPKVADWFIIGAETGNRDGKIVPKKAWIDDLVKYADSWNIPVFMKDSLIPIVGEKNMRREYPWPDDAEYGGKLEGKLYDICNFCGYKHRKNEMIALSARSARGEMPKQFAYACTSCFEKICNDNGIEIPTFSTRRTNEKS